TRGVQIARNDDGGGRGLCSQITLPAGEYELAVTGFNNLAVAPYLLSVRAAGVCGDGTVNTGEQCDPGADVPDDFCDGACQFIAGCGNGRVDAGEECDDGNVAVGDGCDGACQREPECGDGFVDAPEQCDDGNLDVGDGCDAACAFEQECGNGVVEGTEACDDGNVANGDGCDAGCTMENFPANRGALFIQADGVGLGARDRFDFVVDTEATVVGQNGSDEALACAGIGDSLMRLYAVNPDGTLGNPIAADDDSGTGLCSRIERLLQPGAYAFTLEDLGNNAPLPPYVFSFRLAVDVSAGGDFPGAYTLQGNDLYVLEVAEAGDFVLQTSNGQGGCNTDTRMNLYPLDAQGVRGQPVFNDDGGPGLCSRIAQALAVGRYEIEVDGFGGGAAPAYVLSVDLPGGCGDGELNAGEACDPGPDVPGDFCDAQCQLIPGCGNGVVEAGETCDDGNQADGDGCDSACTAEAFQALAGRYSATDAVGTVDAHAFMVDGAGTRVTAVLTDGQG
ncbi:MAG: DUF4215 domain-containing protein, partial [Myxococcales bacterium]|nr:DUF4215 domain-containing protein [Myxococcales bacterium]